MTSDDLCSVFELRRYTLRPGATPDFVALFDAELVESQEAVGMTVVGQFTDLDRPDAFVWIRGFRDMPTRRSALTAFYGGPVWAEHRTTANAMMLDSDDVLLLRPVGASLERHMRPRTPPGSDAPSASAIAVHIRPIDEPMRTPADSVVDAGEVLAGLVTDPTPNNFPRLPVRDDVDVRVTVVRLDEHRERVDGGPGATLRLLPTGRSALR